MDRRFAEPILLAVLAIGAIAAAAATLPTVTETGTGGSGGGPFESGTGEGGLIPTPDPQMEPLVTLPDLGGLVGALVGLMLLAALVYALAYRREFVRAVLALAVLIGVLFALVWLASFFDVAAGGRPGGGDWLFGDPAGSEGERSPLSGPVLLVVVLAVVAAGVVAMAFSSGRITRGGESPPDEEPTAEASAVAEAAGRAADRLEESADLDNEVYRAWLEMTDHLDVSRPESSTPGDFADAAVEAGMARSDVGTLTRLFEDVRYGGHDVTEEAERRAIAILRRIEATYASEEVADP